MKIQSAVWFLFNVSLVNSFVALKSTRKAALVERKLLPLNFSGDGSQLEPLSVLNQITSGRLEDIDVVNLQSQLYSVFEQIISSAGFVPAAVSSLVFSLLYTLSFPPEGYINGNEPYLRGQYDPEAARQFYSKRPLLVLRRALQLFRLSNGFLSRILYDKYILRDEERYIKERAQELLELVQKIGPTAIKVGQALSVRSDLIPAAYAEALQTLQDNVPAFPSSEAQQVLKKELGSRYSMLKTIDLSKPVASASIGQVYRGYANVYDEETKSTKEVEVAVKVQRPNVLSEIALDLFIVREFAPYYQKITKASTDLQGLAQEWGRGFIAELTYDKERENTKRFNQQMIEKGLNAVCAPTVIDELSTNRVLTTEWVRGERLDKSQAEDVPRLCSVALNAYLVMLLETGCLHCDPHPGNLLRREDGKLVILDFGMTLDTPVSLQYSLLEFIAHLTSENFEQVPQDLVNLDFLKEEKMELIAKAGLLEPLYYFLRQANMGGGGTQVRDRIFAEYREKYPGANDDELRVFMRQEMKDQSEAMAKKASAVTGITMKVEDLQRQNKDAFKIPEWFLYTSRAFLTLEGISLQADPNFSITKSCFPYVAKRLLGDDSQRAQAALRDLIYGKDQNLNIEKISDVLDGFTKYTTTTKIVSQGKNVDGPQTHDGKRATAFSSSEAVLTLAKDSADILLAPSGNLVQNLLIEESAIAVNANVKDTLRRLLVDNPKQIRSSLPLGLGNFLPEGPVNEVERFLKKTERERQLQLLVDKLSSNMIPPNEVGDILRSFGGQNSDSIAKSIESLSVEDFALFSKAFRENASIYGPRAAKLGSKFVSTVFDKASHDIDDALNSVDTAQGIGFGEQLVRASARSVSEVAKRSSVALKRT